MSENKFGEKKEKSRTLGFLVALDLADLEIDQISGGGAPNRNPGVPGSAGDWDRSWSQDGNFTVQDDPAK